MTAAELQQEVIALLRAASAELEATDTEAPDGPGELYRALDQLADQVLVLAERCRRT